MGTRVGSRAPTPPRPRTSLHAPTGVPLNGTNYQGYRAAITRDRETGRGGGEREEEEGKEEEGKEGQIQDLGLGERVRVTGNY